MDSARDLDGRWLDGFLSDLRDEGFRIDGRHFAAAHLLHSRAVLENLPLARLGSRLAPILVTSPGEQTRFQSLFAEALPRQSGVSGSKITEIETGERRSVAWSAFAGLLCIAALCAVVWAASEYFEPASVTVIPPENPITAPTVSEGTGGAIFDPSLIVPDNPATIPVTKFSPDADPAKRNVWAVLPIAAFIGWLVWHWLRRRSWLGRKFGKPKPVSTHPTSDKLFARRGFRRAAQNLRRHRAEPTTMLDIPATVNATVDACGQFAPVMATRATTPEYIVLIERFHREDHVAKLAVAATDRLRNEGVAVERYFFGYDPRICRDEAGAAIPLARLRERSRNRRLIIVGEAEGFTDPLTEEPDPWTESLAAWPDRTLFSARRIPNWGAAESGLLEDGLNLATATPRGIAAYAELPDDVSLGQSGMLLEGKRVIDIRSERIGGSRDVRAAARIGADVGERSATPNGKNPRWLPYAAACTAISAVIVALPLIIGWLEPKQAGETIENPAPISDASRTDLEVFRDPLGGDVQGPEMVVIPAGSFMMGSPESEEGRYDTEGPQREVSIVRFALSRTEITFDDWGACVDAKGCQSNPSPSDEGWGRGSRPVINVSWDDAKEYVAWLNRSVGGAPYRLPSEAEWEYAARARTTTAYPWGEEASHEQANYGTDECCNGLASGRDEWVNTSPVGSFPSNSFGLQDMHGNVLEWVEDCWHEDYEGAPQNGSPWLSQQASGCSQRVLRGGSWYVNPRYLRSADRGRNDPVDRDDVVGFRLARTLTP